MKKPLLECCVDTVESAVAAKEGGADRLELCANLIIGGTTPDINLHHRIREKCDILINPISVQDSAISATPTRNLRSSAAMSRCSVKQALTAL